MHQLQSSTASCLLYRLRSETARKNQKRLAGTIAVVTAATANSVVAEECRAVADAMGCVICCLQLPASEACVPLVPMHIGLFMPSGRSLCCLPDVSSAECPQGLCHHQTVNS